MIDELVYLYRCWTGYYPRQKPVDFSKKHIGYGNPYYWTSINSFRKYCEKLHKNKITATIVEFFQLTNDPLRGGEKFDFKTYLSENISKLEEFVKQAYRFNILIEVVCFNWNSKFSKHVSVDEGKVAIDMFLKLASKYSNIALNIVSEPWTSKQSPDTTKVAFQLIDYANSKFPRHRIIYNVAGGNTSHAKPGNIIESHLDHVSKDSAYTWTVTDTGSILAETHKDGSRGTDSIDDRVLSSARRNLDDGTWIYYGFDKTMDVELVEKLGVLGQKMGVAA